jgi:manganese/iron transport system permease protein
VGALVILTIALFYKELLLASFDRVAAQAMGLPVFWLDLLLLVLISLTIVVSLRAVGNILVVAMLVTPAAAARLLTDRMPVMIALSGLIGVLSGVTGLYISFHNDIAAGGTIVLVATAVFGLVWLLAPQHGFITTRALARRVPAAEQAETRIVFESPEIQTPGRH